MNFFAIDGSLVANILARMAARRKRELGSHRATCTMSYAISVTSESIYVGYNTPGETQFSPEDERYTVRKERFNSALSASPAYSAKYESQTPFIEVYESSEKQTPCAETSAASIALSYGERISNLVFISMNMRGDLFNPCETCFKMVWFVRGLILKKEEKIAFYSSTNLNEYEEQSILRAIGPQNTNEVDIYKTNPIYRSVFL